MWEKQVWLISLFLFGMVLYYDHIGVFVGKTGVANFFISLWDGFILERVHIKRASKIIANMITERKIESSLS